MSLVRSNMRLRLTTVSARARGAPGQAWRPAPNATCNRAFARPIWNSPGFSNLRESRLAALLAIYRKVPAGISTPPTLVGLFANRKSPLTGPSIRRHSSMREFRKQRPDVRVQLFDADLPTLIKMVEAGRLDMSLGIFKAMADVRREPFFRFSLMVARASKDDIPPRRTTKWSALDGETLISLSSGHPHQQLIDKHLARAGVKVQIGSIVNLLDTQIALVEAEEGIAVIPSFGMPACRNRKVVMSQLINPVVRFDFHLISSRARELPPGADEFTSFLKSYVATWAGRTGVL
jgi:hypothetical protein